MASGNAGSIQRLLCSCQRTRTNMYVRFLRVHLHSHNHLLFFSGGGFMSTPSVLISSGPVALFISEAFLAVFRSSPAGGGCWRFCSMGGIGGGNLRKSSASSMSTRCFWNSVPLFSSFAELASFLSDLDLSETKVIRFIGERL